MDASLRGKPNAIFDRIQFCHDLTLETALPAKIVEVYKDHTALAQSLIKLESEDGECDCQPILVTTLWDFHGDFEIHHPLNVGDTGWLIGSVRNTDLAKQYNCHRNESENEGPQTSNNDKNLHKSRFGFFFPDRWDERDNTRQTVHEELRDCFYIQDRNGWCKVLLDEEGHIAISAKSSVEISGDTTFDDDAVFGGEALFKSTVKVDGAALLNSLTVRKEASFASDVTIDGSLFVNGKRSRINDMVEQELVCVTGVEQDSTGRTTLKLERMTVLRSRKDHEMDIDIKVPEGGGGDGGGEQTVIYADDKSIRFFDDSDGVHKLELMHWNDDSANSESAIDSTCEVPVRVGGKGGTLQYRKMNDSDCNCGAMRYDPNTGMIYDCHVMAGRTVINAGSFNVGKTYSGPVYAIIRHPASSSTATLEMSKTSQNNTDELTCVQVYQFSSGKVSSDYRGMICLALYE